MCFISTVQCARIILAKLHASWVTPLQEPHAKQVKELLVAQEAVAKERTRLEALQEEIKTKQAELTAQVCLCICLLLEISVFLQAMHRIQLRDFCQWPEAYFNAHRTRKW